MLRLSRSRWAVFFAVIFFLGFEALAIYLFVMNRRLTSELVSHSWRQPMTFVSAARPVVLKRVIVAAHVTRKERCVMGKASPAHHIATAVPPDASTCVRNQA